RRRVDVDRALAEGLGDRRDARRGGGRRGARRQYGQGGEQQSQEQPREASGPYDGLHGSKLPEASQNWSSLQVPSPSGGSVGRDQLLHGRPVPSGEREV